MHSLPTFHVFADVAKTADPSSVADSRIVAHHDIIPDDYVFAEHNVLPYQDSLTFSCDFHAEKLFVSL